MIKQLSFLTLLIILHITKLYANPSPLRLQLNKATLDDVKKSYKIVKTIVNALRYHSHYLDTNNISINALSEAIVITNAKNIVEGILLVLKKDEFDDIYKSLSSKYKVVHREVPFVGNKVTSILDKGRKW